MMSLEFSLECSQHCEDVTSGGRLYQVLAAGHIRSDTGCHTIRDVARAEI